MRSSTSLLAQASWRMAFFIMRKTQKIIIIISVLLAPVFVFLFLKKFGQNEFELPVYYPEGNPIAKCSRGIQHHKFSLETLNKNNIELPVLIYVPAAQQNEYYSDLNNVLAKYPGVNLRALIIEGNSVHQEGRQSLRFDSLSLLNFINCELILGEDRYLKQPVTNKYVLIDGERNIRGYYDCTDLEEIERLDVELDILLNY